MARRKMTFAESRVKDCYVCASYEVEPALRDKDVLCLCSRIKDSAGCTVKTVALEVVDEKTGKRALIERSGRRAARIEEMEAACSGSNVACACVSVEAQGFDMQVLVLDRRARIVIRYPLICPAHLACGLVEACMGIIGEKGDPSSKAR